MLYAVFQHPSQVLLLGAAVVVVDNVLLLLLLLLPMLPGFNAVRLPMNFTNLQQPIARDRAYPSDLYPCVVGMQICTISGNTTQCMYSKHSTHNMYNELLLHLFLQHSGT
jgi:hypothetical protein